MSLPPLLGDAQGHYRILITGNSGVGKTTLAGRLSAILKIPHISLDRIFWKPNWEQTPTPAFREQVLDAMRSGDEEHGGWVIDGNYERRLGSVVFDTATDVIWLDPPLLLYFPRLVIRTFRRLLGMEPNCSSGCEEDIREVFFSKDSIIWWCLSQHWINRRRGWAKMSIAGIGMGSDVARRRVRRISGWGGELTRWVAEVEDAVKTR